MNIETKKSYISKKKKKKKPQTHKEDKNLVLSLVHLQGQKPPHRLVTAGVERCHQFNGCSWLIVCNYNTRVLR